MVLTMSRHVTHSNLMATAAVFIALGGTSYAAARLARDSVGSKQIRTGAVGASEIRRGAVSSRDIRNGSVRVRDLSSTTRDALRGPTGPIGPIGPAGPASAPYFASVDATGHTTAGNATGNRFTSGTNAYRLAFSRSLDGCAATATLATAAPEGEADTGGGYATVGRQGNEVVVRTYAADGSAKAQPFNVLLAC